MTKIKLYINDSGVILLFYFFMLVLSIFFKFGDLWKVRMIALIVFCITLICLVVAKYIVLRRVFGGYYDE